MLKKTFFTGPTTPELNTTPRVFNDSSNDEGSTELFSHIDNPLTENRRGPNSSPQRKSSYYLFLHQLLSKNAEADLSKVSDQGLHDDVIAPYLALEKKYKTIFSTTEIRHLESPNEKIFGVIPDAELDRPCVINTAKDNVDSIGTTGLTTCIAVCARGENSAKEPILGIYHSSGMNSAEDVLCDLHLEMKKNGVGDFKTYLVGGMIISEKEGSLQHEEDLLSHNKKYKIVGAKLHLSKGEYRSNGNLNCVNVVLSGEGIWYSHDKLFESAASESTADESKSN